MLALMMLAHATFSKTEIICLSPLLAVGAIYLGGRRLIDKIRGR